MTKPAVAFIQTNLSFAMIYCTLHPFNDCQFWFFATFGFFISCTQPKETLIIIILKDNKNVAWPWPDELDALTASPEHHKLLLENDTVRVLDTLIRPNEITALHTHKWPATLYILSWSDFVRYDDKNNIVVDSRHFDKSPPPSSILTPNIKPEELSI